MHATIRADSLRVLLAGTGLAVASWAMPNHAIAGCEAPPHAAGLHALAIPAPRPAAASVLSRAVQVSNDAAQHHHRSIVGLWHTVYTWNGATAWEAFDSWYADGNEFEAADLQIGAMCQGTWESSDSGQVQLYHVGWNFTPDGLTLKGYFVETQTDTVSADGNSYDGNYVLNNFDMMGNPDPTLPDQVGTVHATRLGGDRKESR